MSPWLVLGLVAGFLAIAALGWWLTWTARRLDRLHHRLDLAEAALVTQLEHRAAVAGELGTSGLLDPASSLLLLDAAAAARPGRFDEDVDVRDTAEEQSRLSQTIRSVFVSEADLAHLPEDAADLVGSLAAACRKVELARRFHNDQVTATRALRSRRRVRWLALAGRAPAPATIDLDDGVPPAFSEPGPAA